MELFCRVFRSCRGQEFDLVVPEPVAGALEGDDLSVVDDAVDHRGGDDLASEDIAPAGEAQVRGQDQRGVFIAGGHELEEQVRGVLFERDVADFVDLCGHPHRSTI